MFRPIAIKTDIFRPFVAGLTVLLFCGSAAQGLAAPEAPRTVSRDTLDNASRLYPGLNSTNVADVAAAIGFGTTVLQIDGRHPLVAMEDERGLRLVAEPMVCDGEAPEANCQALLVYAYFGGSAAMHNSMVHAANRYNEVQFFARGHITSGSDAVVSRLVIGEHGITRGNLAAELFTMRIAVYNYARLVGLRNSETGQMVQSGGGRDPVSPSASSGVARPFAGEKFAAGTRPDVFGGRIPEVASDAAAFEGGSLEAGSVVGRWKSLGLYADYETDLPALLEGLGLDPVKPLRDQNQ